MTEVEEEFSSVELEHQLRFPEVPEESRDQETHDQTRDQEPREETRDQETHDQPRDHDQPHQPRDHDQPHLPHLPQLPQQPHLPQLPRDAGPAEEAAPGSESRWVSAVQQFKLKRFFVLRPGSLDQAITDVEAVMEEELDGSVHSVWLMAEVDHWNNEKERLVFITDNSLLVCKYDFAMLSCEQIQRIPLNFVDRISHGTFSFPKGSLLLREGEGVRVFWDRQREPSFTSRWNPFATDYPFMTFTYHPLRNINEKFVALCEIQTFCEQLREAAEKAHSMKPVPGKANGVLVLNQPIPIEAYVGLMSFIGNQNKLGYCVARGNIGF